MTPFLTFCRKSCNIYFGVAKFLTFSITLEVVGLDRRIRREKLVVEDGVARFVSFPIKHGFTTLGAGNMSYRWTDERARVDKRFQSLHQRMDLDPKKQVHILPRFSDEILFVDQRDAGMARTCDGMITTTPGLWLSLCPADCFQFIFTGNAGPRSEFEGKQFIGLIHAGWANTDMGITKRAICLIADKLDTAPQELQIVVGPGIQACCYNERKVVLRLLLKPRWWRFMRIRMGHGFPIFLDLLKYNIHQMIQSGVRPEKITVANHCTCCSKDPDGKYLFFSHHRRKNSNEKEGRFLTFVALGEGQ